MRKLKKYSALIKVRDSIGIAEYKIYTQARDVIDAGFKLRREASELFAGSRYGLAVKVEREDYDEEEIYHQQGLLSK